MRPKRLIRAMLIAAAVAAFILLSNRACYFLRYGLQRQNLKSSILDVDKNFDFPSAFPSDPGKEGRKNIVGADVDNDGVRDDIQRWIYALHPQDPRKVNALRQMARYYQHSLHPEFGPEIRRENIVIMRRAHQCLTQSYEDDIQEYWEMLHLKAKALNTYERTARYMDNDTKVTTEEMSGEYPEYPQPCDH